MKKENSPRVSPAKPKQRATWLSGQSQSDFGPKDNESEVVVWPSKRNRGPQESQSSSEWIKWHSKREEREGQEQIEDARMMETHRTAVEQKAKNYLQENARNFIEQVEEDQVNHRQPITNSPPIHSSPSKRKQTSPPTAAFSPKKDHGEDQVIESKPPQYDFEKLIERALQEAGEELPTQSQISSNQRAAPKGQP